MVTMFGTWGLFLKGALFFVAGCLVVRASLNKGVFSQMYRGMRIVLPREERPAPFWLFVAMFGILAAIGLIIILPNIILWTRWGVAYIIMSPTIIRWWLTK